MYAYSQDKKHLVFQDGFGQTRVIFGKKHKAKTDRKECSSHRGGRVSMNDAGDMVLTHRDLWDKTTLWHLPSMKPVERFERFRKSQTTLHPDGTHLLSMVYHGETYPTLVFEEYPSGKETHVSLHQAGDVAFPDDVWLSQPVDLVTGPGKSFAALGKGVVIDGFVHDTSVKVVNRKKAALEGEVQLFATVDGAAVVAHLAGTSTVYTPSGDVYALESVCPAQVGGGWVAWQPDLETIARRPLEGGDEELFTLEGDDAGYAMLFPGEDALCVVPWHREDVLDLPGAQRVSRKLKADELPVRRALVEYIHPYQLASRDVALSVEWGDFSLDKKRATVSVTRRVSSAPSASADVFFKLLDDSWEQMDFGGYRSSSYGSVGRCYNPGKGVTLSDESVREAIEWLQSYGCRLRRPYIKFFTNEHLSDAFKEWLDDADFS